MNTLALVPDRKVLGGMADEVPLTSRSIRQEENERWRLRAKRVVVPFVQEPKAAEDHGGGLMPTNQKTVTGVDQAFVNTTDPRTAQRGQVNEGDDVPKNLADGELDRLTALGVFDEHPRDAYALGATPRQSDEPGCRSRCPNRRRNHGAGHPGAASSRDAWSPAGRPPSGE